MDAASDLEHEPGVVRVLLNATQIEVNRIGGDFTYYRDLQRLSEEHLQMRMVPDRLGRRLRWLARRAAERACRKWEPASLRRQLLLRGRTVPIASRNLHETDLVLSHLWAPLLPATCQLPTVWSSQGIGPAAYYDRHVSGGQWNLDDVVEFYRVLSSRVSALLIWTERGAQNVLADCPGIEDKIYVIHPPVHGPGGGLEVKPSVLDGIVRVLFVGVNAEEKGLREALRAYIGARSSGAQCQFTVVSKPPPDLIDRLTSTSGVRLFPPVPQPDVHRLMAESDVLVMPTHADSYAKVAVEAMAYGCAVVITDLEPLPEVVPDGQVGFTVPIGDDVELTRKLVGLVGNPALLRRMQAEARRLHLRRNSPGVVREKIVRMAEQILQRKSRHARPATVA